MADGVSINIHGLPEFKSRLQALGADMEKKIVRSGALAAGAIFKKAAVANAPRLEKPDKRRIAGALKKGVYFGRSRSKSGGGREVVVVGVRAGKAKSASDPFYWRWVEAGHLVRGRGQKIKGGKRRAALERERLQARGAKSVPGVFFMRNAFRDNQAAAINAFNTRIEARIQKANQELNNK